MTAAATAGSRRPVRVVLAVVALVLLALPFGILTALVVDGGGGLEPVDREVSDAANRLMSGHPAWVSALKVLATVTEPTVLRVIATVLAVVVWRRGRHRVALWLVVTMWAGGYLAIALKLLVRRTRPEFAEPVAHAAGFAFPSGHAFNSMLFAGCLLTLVALRAPRGGADTTSDTADTTTAGDPTTVSAPARRLMPVAVAGLLFVLVVAADRLLLGVHYVSDILGGWVIAVAVLLVSLAVAAPWRER